MPQRDHRPSIFSYQLVRREIFITNFFTTITQIWAVKRSDPTLNFISGQLIKPYYSLLSSSIILQIKENQLSHTESIDQRSVSSSFTMENKKNSNQRPELDARSGSNHRRHGCHPNEEVQEVLDNLSGFIFGSCATVAHVVENLVPESWQQHENEKSNHLSSSRKKSRHLDPRLARFVGRYQSKSINPQELTEESIFLENTALSTEYIFDEHTTFDDNISALSAYTLEEMARINGHHHMKQVNMQARFGRGFPTAPPVAKTNSSSSSSQQEEAGLKLLQHKARVAQTMRASKAGAWKSIPANQLLSCVHFHSSLNWLESRGQNFSIPQPQM